MAGIYRTTNPISFTVFILQNIKRAFPNRSHANPDYCDITKITNSLFNLTSEEYLNTILSKCKFYDVPNKLLSEIEPLDSNSEAFESSFKRSELDTSEFGLPDKRKFPIHDQKHVLAAIKFFNYAKPDEEKELANNIKKKIKEFHMEIKKPEETNNRFYQYL